AGRSQNGPSRHLNTEFHIIHLPCKCLENAPQAAFWPNIYPQILLTSQNSYHPMPSPPHDLDLA
ncbi:MAG: hypothetical protein L6306_06165, partial [Planctomycetales bacterium]|nr:hypothetical protein [Planctomycetales bacterium]